MTDTDALTERIARALYENAEYYGPEDVQPAWEHRDDEERDEWREIAAAVLPTVAEEVRKAKAEAWYEAYWEGQSDSRYDFITPNPYRETGGSDDHDAGDHRPGEHKVAGQQGHHVPADGEGAGLADLSGGAGSGR